MSLRQTLLAEIEQHCRDTGLTERAFGWAAVDDGRLVERLRAGKATLKVIERAEAYLKAQGQQVAA